MDFFGSMVGMPTIATWSALANFHGHSVPPKLVALFAKMRLATAKKSGYVAAKITFECNVLVSMCVASGWEILIAVQAVDALPRLLCLGLFVCCSTFVLPGIARFLAITVGMCVRKRESCTYKTSAMHLQAYHELPFR